MKKALFAAFTMTVLVPHHATAANPPGKPNGTVPQLTPQQKQQLLGEVIGVGIAGAVIGAAINQQNNQRPSNNNGYNNYNNNGWNNNNNNYNNNGWNNNNSNGGRRYDYVPSSNSRPQQPTVYRENYSTQPQRVYSQQPVYSSTIEGERIISSSPTITGERVISSSPVITSERVISSTPSFSSERVVSSSPTVSSERVVTATPVKENSLPYKGPGVTIRLTQETGGNVSYLIDGVEEATIEAGQEQTLTKKGKYEIRFSRGRSPEGADFGQARYTITEGAYAFEVTEKGWELHREKDLATTASVTPSPSGLKTNTLPSKAAPASSPTSVLVGSPTAATPSQASDTAASADPASPGSP